MNGIQDAPNGRTERFPSFHWDVTRTRIRSDPCGLDQLIAVRSVWARPAGRRPARSRNVAAVLVPSSEPVRRFRWRDRQRHCPGLRFMVSHGRHRGFESLDPASQKTLPHPGPRVAGVQHPDAARRTTTCCTRHRWRTEVLLAAAPLLYVVSLPGPGELRAPDRELRVPVPADAPMSCGRSCARRARSPGVPYPGQEQHGPLRLGLLGATRTGHAGSIPVFRIHRPLLSPTSDP
jgi:hypothetical protein